MSFARLSPVALRNLDNAHLQTLEERGRDAFSRAQHSALCLPRDASYSSTWRDAADLTEARISVLDSPAQARFVPCTSVHAEIHLDHLAWARLLHGKIRSLQLAECKLDTVIAVARALFMQPTMHVVYDELRVYEAGNMDECVCYYDSPRLLAEARALGPGALNGFIMLSGSDVSAWRELVN